MAERLYFIVDKQVKSKETPEHQHWPDQSRPIQEKLRIGRLWVNITLVITYLVKIKAFLYDQYDRK